MQQLLSNRHSNLKWFFLLFALYNTIDVNAQSWIPFTNNQGKCISERTLRNDSVKYEVEFVINGLYNEDFLNNGHIYHQISFGEKSIAHNIGEPNLPLITQFIKIPNDVSCKISVIDQHWTEISIGRIYPVQEQIIDASEEMSFVYHEEVYQQELFATNLIEYGKPIKWGDKSFLGINIRPFKYYPREGRLAVLSQFTLSIDYAPMVKDGNENHTLVEERLGGQGSSQLYDYLIIYGDIFGWHRYIPAMRDFGKWKAHKGIKLGGARTRNIGNTPEQIKAFIKSEHDSNPRLKYVLLVGDEDKIPMKALQSPVDSGIIIKSDYWYGCLDGDNDYDADISVGRFSTNDFEEIGNIVNKIIKYEKGQVSHPEKVLLVAHRENPLDGSQKCLEEIRNNVYDEDMSFCRLYGASIANQGDAATNADVINYINNGINIVNYHGHGLSDRWQEWNIYGEDFSSSQINNIDNDVCSIFFSCACQTGRLYDQTCLLETFTRSDHGAVAFIGASYNVYTIVNFDYNKALYNNLLNNQVYRIGDLNCLAHTETLSKYINADIGKKTSQHNALIYVCGGDPSLEIWTDTIKTISNVSLKQISSKLCVYLKDFVDFQVVVLDEYDGLKYTAYSDNHYCFVTAPTGKGKIIINKHNYLPYEINFDATTDVVQNDTIIDNTFYLNSPIIIGKNVTSSKPYGDVRIEGNSTLWLNKKNGITIQNGFRVETGAQLKIE